MKRVHIEWQHIENNGKTCDRCAKTGETLSHVIRDLVEEGVIVDLSETKLATDETKESNRVFFNGVALEELLPDVTVSENACTSCADVCGCGDLCGATVNCRTIASDGTTYEAIPAGLIRRAALAAAKLQD